MGWQYAGLVFFGCIFIGGGIGQLLNRPQAGWMIGMGAGFLAMGLVAAFAR